MSLKNGMCLSCSLEASAERIVSRICAYEDTRRTLKSKPLIPITASFPASEAFDAINEALKADDAARKSALKTANAVFAFTLKNKAGETESWHIDLKEKGTVGKGLGEKPTGMFPSRLQRITPKVADENPYTLFEHNG